MFDPYLGLGMVEGYAFSPLAPPRHITLPVTPLIQHLMQESFDQAEMALEEGGTPVGAALIEMETGQEWYDRSDDKITGNLQGHAEIKCYQQAQSVVGSRLGKCALVSTTELCPMCVSTYAQGDISTIIIAAPRKALVREDGTPILRPRKVNMGTLLEDSAAQSNVYVGYRSADSLALWRTWDDQRRGK